MRVTFHLTGENNRDEHTVTKMTKKKDYHSITVSLLQQNLLFTVNGTMFYSASII